MVNQIVFANSLGNNVPTLPVLTDAATSIPKGWPVIQSAPFGVACSTGMPVVGTDVVMGISNGASTDTSTEPGTVDAHLPLPGLVYMLPALDPTAIDTQVKYDALVGTLCVFDVSIGGVITVDTGAVVKGGLQIVPSNISKDPGMVKFVIESAGTYL